MIPYRLDFTLNGEVLTGEPFNAGNDRIAKSHVEARRGERAAKLWHLQRLVRSYPAGPL